jgi:PBP1b-binding outer membrane lipoprotein LpoB
LPFGWTMHIASVFALALLVAACARAPAAQVAQDPANPLVPVPPVSHKSAIGTYQSQRPVEPGSWREQNERVAPRPKQ